MCFSVCAQKKKRRWKRRCDTNVVNWKVGCTLPYFFMFFFFYFIIKCWFLVVIISSYFGGFWDYFVRSSVSLLPFAFSTTNEIDNMTTKRLILSYNFGKWNNMTIKHFIGKSVNYPWCIKGAEQSRAVTHSQKCLNLWKTLIRFHKWK